MEVSERHHYLPQFYMKGFTNDVGKLWVYDKATNSVCNEPKAPRQIFYEWKGNTIDLGNEQFDFIEKSFSETDSQVAKYFLEIRNSEIDSIEDLAHVAYLV